MYKAARQKFHLLQGFPAPLDHLKASQIQGDLHKVANPLTTRNFDARHKIMRKYATCSVHVPGLART